MHHHRMLCLFAIKARTVRKHEMHHSINKHGSSCRHKMCSLLHSMNLSPSHIRESIQMKKCLQNDLYQQARKRCRFTRHRNLAHQMTFVLSHDECSETCIITTCFVYSPARQAELINTKCIIQSTNMVRHAGTKCAHCFNG